MPDIEIGYQEDPKNSNGITRARTTGQLRSWHIPRAMKALEKLNSEMGKVIFPGNYILFDQMKVYIGEAGSVYDRLKTHMKTPDAKIKNWDSALILNDGRPATQSDFNDPVVRCALEFHLISLFKANKYRVVSQGRQPARTATQNYIVTSLIYELDHFLLKKNIITKVLEDEGLQEIFGDELKKLLTACGKHIQKWSAYEAVIDGQKSYIRPGSIKSKGWQITFRDRFLNSLEKGDGCLLVSRDGVLLIPLSEIQRLVSDKAMFNQNTIDIYMSFAHDKVTASYKDNRIDVTQYKLRG